MKLIVLYGPPAAGKYTIAKAVAERTGFKLFHNHLTVDLLKTIFEYGTLGFFELSQKIRLDVFEEAAKQNIPGMVFTFVYEKNTDDTFIKELLEQVTKYGGEVTFIQIYCEKEVLLQRVKEDSRKEFQKVKSEEALQNTLSNSDQMSSISFVASTRIDNTHLSAEEAVQKVLEIIKENG
jgi:shikimate kinase